MTGERLDVGSPPAGASPVGEERHDDGGPLFWIATAIGWAIILLGVRMGLHDRELEPSSLAKWVAGGLILHDLVWLTVVAVIGAVLAYMLRGRVPVVLGWALATTAVLTIIAWPFVRGYGRRADVPSALQRNYAQGLLAYIAVTWLLALAAYLVGRWRRSRGRPG
jgi:high-affinity Fe2+/Pb2+ permease